MGLDHRLRARRADRRGIPAELPADEVERVPFFGTTWYTHGIGYWFRRVLAALLMLAGLLTAFAFEYAAFSIGSTFSAAPARWAWYITFAVLLVVSFVRPTRAALDARRRRKAGLVLRPDYTPGMSTRAGGGGAGVGYLATTGSVAAGAFLLVSVVFFFGWFVFLFLWTLAPEYGVEHDARLRLQKRYP